MTRCFLSWVAACSLTLPLPAGAVEAGATATLRGMFRYMADAADFQDCASGRRFPVAMEGDYADLERAYLAMPREGPAPVPVMAVLEGQIAMRPPMEGPGPVPTLVVDRFLELLPGQTCPPHSGAVPLLDTYWRLVALDEEAVSVPEGGSAPYLILRREERRAVGSNGCNRFLAGYTLESDSISFLPAAATRMACPGAEELADHFNRLVGSAVRWRVQGEQLELYDAGGRVVARFQAESTP